MSKPLFPITVLLCLFATALAAKPLAVSLEVDATEISRKLVHSRMTFEVDPGKAIFRYPEWIPGIHAPRGPIQNMGGLRFLDSKGNTMQWERDPKDRYRFHVDVPKGVRSLTIELDYICNQPSTNSRGVDTYGNSFIGAINWNTLLMYPETKGHEEIEFSTTLTLPDSWKLGCAIKSNRNDEGKWILDTVSMSELVDSPAIIGEHFRSFDLKAPNFVPTRLHVTSESAAALNIPEETIDKFSNLAIEAGLLFGGAHFDEYDFLVFCSDELPKTGLEHLKSSLNGISERALVDEKKLLGWEGYLLPHEFVHSWCGKYRRPAGMHTHDYHTVKDTRLLWVYEGLTQHLGEVLTVRSGIWDLEHFRQTFASKISSYRAISGRKWRSLEDTANDSYHLRGGSRHWSGVRRGQDYYNEGLMFWLEVDSILREKTDSKVTLDDFAVQFLGAGYQGGVALPFTEEDVITELNKLMKYDWEALIERRISNTQETLPLEFVERLGYKLRYASEASDAQKEIEKTYKFATAYDSLGMTVSAQGTIGSNIVPGMPADQAGLAPGMKVIGINDRKFSLDRFRESIADSVIRGDITFLVEDGDRFRTFVAPYDSGLRYLELVRDESKPDRIAAIYEARKEKK